MIKLLTKYQAYIFDVGGVLFRWNLEKTAIKYFAPQELSEGLFFLHNIWWRLDKGCLQKKHLEKYLLQKKCPANYIDIIRCIVNNFIYDLEPLYHNLKILEHIVSLNANVFILSNFQYDAYCLLEERYPVLKTVKGKIISGEVNMMKPSKNIFGLAIEKFQVIPTNTLFIDDIKANIESAQNLNFHIYHYIESKEYFGLNSII